MVPLPAHGTVVLVSDWLDPLEKIEDIKAHALQLSEQNMDQAIGIIKSWLKEPAAEKLPAKAA